MVEHSTSIHMLKSICIHRLTLHLCQIEGGKFMVCRSVQDNGTLVADLLSIQFDMLSHSAIQVSTLIVGLYTFCTLLLSCRIGSAIVATQVHPVPMLANVPHNPLCFLIYPNRSKLPQDDNVCKCIFNSFTLKSVILFIFT